MLASPQFKNPICTDGLVSFHHTFLRFGGGGKHLEFILNVCLRREFQTTNQSAIVKDCFVGQRSEFTCQRSSRSLVNPRVAVQHIVPGDGQELHAPDPTQTLRLTEVRVYQTQRGAAEVIHCKENTVCEYIYIY